MSLTHHSEVIKHLCFFSSGRLLQAQLKFIEKFTIQSLMWANFLIFPLFQISWGQCILFVNWKFITSLKYTFEYYIIFFNVLTILLAWAGGEKDRARLIMFLKKRHNYCRVNIEGICQSKIELYIATLYWIQTILYASLLVIYRYIF